MRRSSVWAGLTLVLVGAAGGGATVDWVRARRAEAGVNPPAPAATAPAPAGGAPLTPRTDTPQAARALSQAFAATARALRPSVVRVDVEKEAPRAATRQRGLSQLPPGFERFFNFGGEGGEAPEPGPGRGTGSGVIIDAQGHVVTNRHVVDGASKVTVTLVDGRELQARVVGADERTDVAVVQIQNPPKGLTAARLGDSEKLEVGEWVIAVGSALGIDETVTAGIVSGKGRTMHMGNADRVARGYIQTDAKINPGNSGGPLVNLDGEVVGLNTFINVGPGGAYGFAIPVNDVRRVSVALIKDGHVRYAFLGVSVFDTTRPPPDHRADLPKDLPEGAYVATVTPGSPAARAGLQVGDVITRLDQQPVKGATDVVAFVAGHAVGDDVGVTYVRSGHARTATAALTDTPGEQALAQAGQQGRLGLALQTLTPELAQSLGLPPNAGGVVIADVRPGSPAAEAGLQVGDVIFELDRKQVTSAEDAVAKLRATPGAAHLLRVRGANGTRFVTVKGGVG